MATPATIEAKKRALALPQFRTITITNQEPSPSDRVEVTPEAGRIVFQNNDPLEYRIRLYKPDADPDGAGSIDLLLPANGLLSVIIRENDEFKYSVMTTNNVLASTGKGGGPITN